MNYREHITKRVFTKYTSKNENANRLFNLPVLAISSTLLLTSLTFSAPSMAENIAVPANAHPGDTQKPAKGINKSQVEARFGSPQGKYGPTGEPAIYYWEYPEYTVYFEDNIVIHTVSKSKSLKTY